MPNISFWMSKKLKVLSSPKELQWSKSLIYPLLPETRQAPMKQTHLIGLMILARSNPFFKKPVFQHSVSKWKSQNVYIDLLLHAEILRYGAKECMCLRRVTDERYEQKALLLKWGGCQRSLNKNTQGMKKRTKSGGPVLNSMLITPKVLRRHNI